MMCLLVACARSVAAAPLKTIVALSALVFVLAGSAGAVDFSVGPKEIIYSKNQRTNKKLSTWPDGNLGVVRNAQGTYDFYGANGGSPAKTTGTLTDPGRAKQSVSITNRKQAFDYIAGGPIYQDPTSGARLMIYHAETHGRSAKDFYSMLGMAVSTDASGRQFRDLGIIVQPNLLSGQAEITGGSFAIVGDYMHVYYKDTAPYGVTSELAVARAPISEVVSNALGGRGTSFAKYYNGDWSQPGRGGLSSPLETWNPSNLWASVSYNDYLDKLVMVSSQWTPTQPDLYLATSSDGINWSQRQALVTDAGEQFYPSLVGTGADPTHTDKSFYVYYTDSQKGAWNRWQDAKLVRREITFDPYSAPLEATSPVNPPPASNPTPIDWANVADFRSDFQPGTPATGWKYMYNAMGTRGDSSSFAPLWWSKEAQAYNTTGGATRTPDGTTTHLDDYLLLAAYGGNPGRADFTPIAGYTIQPEDGAGQYRLADTSIQKWDGIVSPGEDGLDLLVYVDNQLISPTSYVSTSGTLTTFDRDLGQLNVGDTVWVMVDSLGNLGWDTFVNFDFSIQKGLPATSTSATMLSSQTVAAVPEPGAAILLFAGVAGGYLMRRPRRRT